MQWGTIIPTVTSVATVSVWMRTTNAPASTSCSIANKWSTSSRNGWGILLRSDGTIQFQCYAASSAVAALVGSTNVTDGVWHNILGTINIASGQPITFYVDGVQQATANASANWTVSSTLPITIGDNVDSFWSMYSGDIAGLSYFHNTTLSADEIKAIGKGFDPLIVAPTKITFYAPLVDRDRELISKTAATVSGTVPLTDGPQVIRGLV
jgi:hypothetical protein